MSRIKKTQNKSSILLSASIIIYLIIVYLITPLYLTNYYGFSFELLVWAGSLTSLLTFSLSWYIYISLLTNLNKLNRKHILVGLLILLIPIELFYIIPIFYGNMIITSIKSILPYTAYTLQKIEDLPSIQQFSLMWALPTLIIPTLFYTYMRKVERPIIVKEKKRVKRS